MAWFTINGIALDPVTQSAALASAGLESADASRSNYILVQARAPLTDEQKARLQEIGVTIQEYLPENTYLCGYRADDLTAVRRLPFVVWSDIYLPGFKIVPSLRPPTIASPAFLIPLAAGPSRERTPREVDIVLHTDVDPTTPDLMDRIAAAVRMNPSDLRLGRHKVRVTVEERFLAELAALDEVRRIEPVPTRVLSNNIAGPILNAHVVVNGTTYEGDGQVITVADTGFDKGSTTNVHPAFTGRVARLYALGRPAPAQTNDPDGHGTHVAGSVLGDGTSSTMGGAIRGTAPRATLVLQSLLDAGNNLGGIPVDLHDLFEPPYRDDSARVHTNSWGATMQGVPYDTSAEEIDDFVWEQPDCVICFSAGNQAADGDGNGVIDEGSVGAEAAAKNCITVGASESNREFGLTYGAGWPARYPANPIAGDLIADHPAGMVAFSRRGPTQEHRFKPDVVAPGTCILSTRSRDLVTAPTDYGTSSDPDFFFDGGTSMSTPLVAGCAAVLRECLIKNGTPTPSAALIKALVINGAVELTGQYQPSEAGPSPNTSSGWGRVNLAGSVIIPGPNPDGGFGEGGPLKQGDDDSFVIPIPKEVPGRAPSGTLPQGPVSGGGGLSPLLKITLVWSDPPGAGLQNDLDLIVVAADGQERHGNMGTSGGFDRDNNVEQVVWPNMPPGDAKIIVHAERITKFPQPYAYAWRIS